MFRRFAVLVGPLIAVAACCPAAAAGPLSWSYKAIVQAGHGGSIPPAAAVLSLSRFDTAGPAATRDGTTAAWATLPAGSSGNVGGSGTVVLAAADRGAYSTGPALPGEAVDGFRTLLEITDAASGVRGFTYVNGTGELWGGDADGDVLLRGTGRVQMNLGANRYDIRWRESNTDSTSRIVADVSVSALVNTPEPATLALAGLGLGAVGLRRLRRK